MVCLLMVLSLEEVETILTSGKELTDDHEAILKGDDIETPEANSEEIEY